MLLTTFGLRPANERRCLKVTPSLIGWAQDYVGIDLNNSFEFGYEWVIKTHRFTWTSILIHAVIKY